MADPNAFRVCVFDRLKQDLLGMRDVRAGSAQTLLRQLLHHVNESAFNFAEDFGVHHADVVGEQLRGIRLILSHFVGFAPPAEP